MWKVSGFEKNKKLFEGVIKNDQLNHAYLFSGQEMIGKKTFALEVAGGGSPDLLLIKPDSSLSGQTISIAEIRALKNFLVLTPYRNKYKFAIIDDAHTMTEEAQNAILKILEEPNSSSILILVTNNPEFLLPTIISRCQEIKFFPHPPEIIKSFLTDTKLTNQDQKFLVQLTNGRLGLIKSIIDSNQIKEVRNEIAELEQILKSDLETKFAVAQKLSDDKNRQSIKIKLLYWMLYLRTNLINANSAHVLTELGKLNQIVSQPQFNLRLALENLFVKTSET